MPEGNPQPGETWIEVSERAAFTVAGVDAGFVWLRASDTKHRIVEVADMLTGWTIVEVEDVSNVLEVALVSGKLEIGRADLLVGAQLSKRQAVVFAATLALIADPDLRRFDLAAHLIREAQP